jgi:hypothetical protein
MADSIDLPEGFQLDQLPEGFQLDEAQPAQQPQQVTPGYMPQGNAVNAVVEPIKAIGSGVLGAIGGGVAGTVQALNPFAEPGAGAEAVKGTQEFFARAGAPTTQAGQEATATVGDLIQKGVDLARFPLSGLAGLGSLLAGKGVDEAADTIKAVQEKGIGKVAGDKVLAETNSPLLATLAEVAPDAAMAFSPLKNIAGKQIAKQTAFKQAIIDQIKSGSTDKSLYKYMIDGAGKLVNDPVGKEVAKQGMDPGVVMTIKGSTPADMVAYNKMLNIVKRGKENALFAAENRVGQVAGDSLLERVRAIKKINRQAGKDVDAAARALEKETIDTSGITDDFMNSLDEMGVRFDERGRPNFVGSDIEGRNLRPQQAAIADMVNRVRRLEKNPSAYEAHRTKKYIDEIVTYGKSGEGLKGKTERVLKGLRTKIDATLDESFPDYAKANTTYSDTVGALDSLQDVAGKKMDLFGPNADKATGNMLRRLMGNAQSRIPLANAIDDLEGVAAKYGATFKDNVKAQALVADELETLFKTTGRTGFAGEAAKGIQKGAEALTGQRTLLGTAAEIAGKAAEKARGINEENALKSITELLKRPK